MRVLRTYSFTGAQMGQLMFCGEEMSGGNEGSDWCDGMRSRVMC